MSIRSAADVRSSRQRRRVRYAAQRVLWNVSSLKRVRACGRRLRSEDGAQLRVTVGEDGRSHAGFAGVQTCGSVWACPNCSARIMAFRAAEIAQAVDGWEATGGRDGTGGQVAFFTFTMRHHAGMRLADIWDALSEGWHAITAGKVHQAEKAVYGQETTRVVASGRRKGETVPCHVLPWLRVVELTHGVANGWHLHVHALVFLDKDVTEDEVHDLYRTWWGRWKAGLESAGVDGALMVNEARVLRGKEVAARIGKYATKAVYTAGEVGGLEVGRGDLKSGRFGNRGIWEVLRDVVLQPNGPELVERDAALWREYEQASKRRRQMTWARGARDLLGLGVEVDDETIADEEVGTVEDAVVNLPPASWRDLVRVPGRRVELLEAVESVPIGQARATATRLLDAWALDWLDAPPPRASVH